MKPYKKLFEADELVKLKRLLDSLGAEVVIQEKPNEILVTLKGKDSIRNFKRIEAEIYEIFSDGKINKKDLFIIK